MAEKIIKIELTVYEALQLFKFHDDFLEDIKRQPNMVKLKETMEKFAEQTCRQIDGHDLTDALLTVRVNQLAGLEPPSKEGI